MLHIHSSNRLELLLDQLVEASATQTVIDPLLPTRVIVQNTGMARWAMQQIAMRQGVSANTQFQTPGVCLWGLARNWNNALPQSPHRKEEMMWRLFELLPALLGRNEFQELQHYLSNDDNGLRLLQLTRAIASTFDRYLIYRPDWINRWESGHELHWQAVLWRELSKSFPHHWGSVAALLPDMAERTPHQPLPEQLSVFGISDMPALYTQMLAAVARHITVHVFYLNPCEQYWADIVDEQNQARRRARARKAGLDDPTGLLDIGNPLLASWGHAGQAFLDQLLELPVDEREYFIAADGSTRLQAVQNHILSLNDTQIDAVAYSDQSIQLHSCHSALREVQILHDQLLSMFESMPGLAPRDVLVMAPDIDRYAPFIDGSFAIADDPMQIPWSVSDRRFRSEQHLLEVVDWLLNLPLSRFESTEILALFDASAVRAKFDIDQNTVAELHRWVKEAGIRWSLDASMRAALDLPATELNSWKFGLTRLFMGYALPDLHGDLYQDISPYAHIEGVQSERLQVLAHVIELCARWRQTLQKAHSAEEWLAHLDQLFEDFFHPDDQESQALLAARSRLFDLLQLDSNAQSLTLSREVFVDLYQQVLEDNSSERQFLNGKVTFSNMVPMRSIPFKVVCVLGLNAEAFPRDDNLPSFDLIANQPRRGDKRRRNDDRYLFLEALMSARDIFYVSYIGRDITDNSEKAPSTVVAELAAYAGIAALEHPLQPFSQRYFDNSHPQLFSYNHQWFQAAGSKRTTQPAKFIDSQFQTDREPPTRVELADLINFFADANKAFLASRLQVTSMWQEEKPDVTEPFNVHGLSRWKLKQDAYRLYKSGNTQRDVQKKLLASGELPVGPIGERELAAVYEGTLELDERVLRHESKDVESIEFDNAYGRFQLQGTLNDLQSDGLFNWRFGKLRAKDLVTCWIRHLLLCDLKPPYSQCSSVLVCEDWTVEFVPVTTAATLLQQLLEIRHQGLMQPSHWFVECALYTFLDQESPPLDSTGKPVKLKRKDDAKRELTQAIDIVWRGTDPLDDAFHQLTGQVLGPLFDHAKMISAAVDSAL